MPFHVTINGELTDVSHIDPDTPLLWALRDRHQIWLRYRAVRRLYGVAGW